jgi:hypothetical protein
MLVIVSAIVVDLVLMSVALPIIQRLEAAKDNIMRTFLAVPRAVVRYLKQSSTIHLALAIAQVEGRDSANAQTLMDKATNAGKIDWGRINMNSRSRQRAFTKGLWGYLWLNIKLAGPLFIVVSSIISMYAYHEFMTGRTSMLPVQMVAGVSRGVWNTRMVSDARSMVLLPRTTPVEELQAQYERVMTAAQRATELQRDQLFSNGLIAAVHTQPSLAALMLKDGCVRVVGPPLPDIDACYSFQASLLREGLGVALHELSARCTHIAAARLHLGANASDTDLMELATGSDMAVVLELERAWLQSGQQESVALHDMYMLAWSSSYKDATLFIITALLALVLTFYAVIYAPAVRALDADMKRIRSLLLMFPSEVIHGVAAIEQMMNDLALAISGGKAGGVA